MPVKKKSAKPGVPAKLPNPKLVSASEILAQTLAEMGDRITVAQGKDFIECLSFVAQRNLLASKKVRIGDLVQLEPRYKPARKARDGRNPRTGETVRIAASPAGVKVAARVLRGAKEATPTLRKHQANVGK